MTFALRRMIDRPWIDLPPRRIGSVPIGLGTPDCYVLIGTDDAPRLRIDLYARHDAYNHAIDVRVWGAMVLVGFAHEVAIVPYSAEPVRTQRVRMYFIRFYDGDGYVLAASGADVTRIDHDGTTAWQSGEVGLDGVVIERIENGVIHGWGEWDPPGGWRPFAISATTGAEVGR